jgi:hypothetical protein
VLLVERSTEEMLRRRVRDADSHTFQIYAVDQLEYVRQALLAVARDTISLPPIIKRTTKHNIWKITDYIDLETDQTFTVKGLAQVMGWVKSDGRAMTKMNFLLEALRLLRTGEIKWHQIYELSLNSLLLGHRQAAAG